MDRNLLLTVNPGGREGNGIFLVAVFSSPSGLSSLKLKDSRSELTSSETRSFKGFSLSELSSFSLKEMPLDRKYSEPQRMGGRSGSANKQNLQKRRRKEKKERKQTGVENQETQLLTCLPGCGKVT